MSVIIFILVLVALIVVHEFGHFITAKAFRMRVEEFGLGYPPRAAVIAKRGGTEYTLNWLPFGGFVRIHGEDDTDAVSHDSFPAKPRWQQATVLLAGIGMNLLFAWLLISITLALGMPRGLSDAEIARAKNPELAVSHILPGSPADIAGLAAGDLIESARAGDETFAGADADAFTSFVARSAGKPIALTVERNGQELTLTATPTVGAVPNAPGRAALGVGVAPFGVVPLAWYEAPITGAEITADATVQIASGLLSFFAGLFTFTADLSQVSGPIGIAGAVGGAASSGAAALLSLTAIISINLALINLLPVPALDGGRLLFVLIEAVTRRRLPSKAAAAANSIGFMLLILLMLVVTAHDLWKIFA